MDGRPSALPRLACDAAIGECVAARTVRETPLVQVVRWRCRHDGEALRAERHHGTFVLSMLQTGACRVHAGSWEATLDPATAVLHAPGATYRTSHPFGCIDSGWSFALREDVGRELVRATGAMRRPWPQPSVTVVVGPGGPGLKHLIALHDPGCVAAGDSLTVEELALDMFETMMRVHANAPRTRDDETARRHRDMVDAARRHLALHFREPLRLEGTAKHVGASPAHLCRLFRRHTGLSMGAYLQRLRLASVVEELGRTGRGSTDWRSLTDVALENGFYSHSHLTGLFTRELGVPPSAVRKLGIAHA